MNFFVEAARVVVVVGELGGGGEGGMSKFGIVGMVRLWRRVRFVVYGDAGWLEEVEDG